MCLFNIYMLKQPMPIYMIVYGVVTDHVVPLHRGERNVDKLGLGFALAAFNLGFDFRVPPARFDSPGRFRYRAVFN